MIKNNPVRPWETLDDWQKEVLATEGNIVMRTGRQVGKSTCVSIKAGEYAMNHKNKTIMIIAAVERSALLLFEKVLAYIYAKGKALIGKGKNKPTKHELKLTNGSKILCLPTGDSGYGIRGHTIDLLIADEAHYVNEEVWPAVIPMLITTGGDVWLLSTPAGTSGFYYDCFEDPEFTKFHISTLEVAKKRDPEMRKRMEEDIAKWEKRLTRLQFQQEYMGEFVGGIQRYFSAELINSVCNLNSYVPKGNKYMGVDVARLGGDETVLVSLDKKGETLIQFDLTITPPQELPDTARLILKRDKLHNYKKIYIDTTGMGWGVFDPLHQDPQTKRKVVSVENLKKNLHKEKGKKTELRKPTNKEEMYMDLKILMQERKIRLLDNPEIRQSLRSILYENDKNGLKIYGNYSHIVEALIRAAQGIKDKSLNIYIY